MTIPGYPYVSQWLFFISALTFFSGSDGGGWRRWSRDTVSQVSHSKTAQKTSEVSERSPVMTNIVVTSTSSSIPSWKYVQKCKILTGFLFQAKLSPFVSENWTNWTKRLWKRKSSWSLSLQRATVTQVSTRRTSRTRFHRVNYVQAHASLRACAMSWTLCKSGQGWTSWARAPPPFLHSHPDPQQHSFEGRLLHIWAPETQDATPSSGEFRIFFFLALVFNNPWILVVDIKRACFDAKHTPSISAVGSRPTLHKRNSRRMEHRLVLDLSAQKHFVYHRKHVIPTITESAGEKGGKKRRSKKRKESESEHTARETVHRKQWFLHLYWRRMEVTTVIADANNTWMRHLVVPGYLILCFLSTWRSFVVLSSRERNCELVETRLLLHCCTAWQWQKKRKSRDGQRWRLERRAKNAQTTWRRKAEKSQRARWQRKQTTRGRQSAQKTRGSREIFQKKFSQWTKHRQGRKETSGQTQVQITQREKTQFVISWTNGWQIQQTRQKEEDQPKTGLEWQWGRDQIAKTQGFKEKPQKSQATSKHKFKFQHWIVATLQISTCMYSVLTCFWEGGRKFARVLWSGFRIMKLNLAPPIRSGTRKLSSRIVVQTQAASARQVVLVRCRPKIVHLPLNTNPSSGSAMACQSLYKMSMCIYNCCTPIGKINFRK